MGASLKRARRPYLIPNILVGFLVASASGGAFWYAMHAVNQDPLTDLILSQAVRDAEIKSQANKSMAERKQDVQRGIWTGTDTLVWGAPDVDRVGRLSDRTIGTGWRVNSEGHNR